MSKVNISSLVVLIVVLSYGLGHGASDGSAAGGPPSSARMHTATQVHDGLNDMLQSVAAPKAGMATTVPSGLSSGSDAVRPQAASALSLADRLRAWSDQTRRNARIQLELPSNVSGAVVSQARKVEALWADGQYDEAIDQLQLIESGGIAVAMGVEWLSPMPRASANDGADVRIGTRTGGVLTKLDYDIPSGNLFSVVRWDTDNGWALYRSTNQGAGWTELYFWYAGSGLHATDVDMAVVGNYVYVGYVASDTANELRLRRLIVGTGQIDNTYAYHVVLDAGTNTFTDVAIESNADSFQNRICCAARQSNNAIRYAWDTSTDGTTFTEDSPAGVSAVGGLDMHWNYGYATYFIWMSYIGTDSRVHVLRYRTTGWDEATSAPFDGSHTRTAISAWDDHVICAHELQMDNGQGIRYFITHDGGETWDYYNYIAEPKSGEGPYQMADVTARGGFGTAIVFTHETGEPDDVIIRYRRGYAPGLWSNPFRVNDHDVSTGTWTSLNWVPTSLNELSYGLTYIFGTTPYFDRFHVGVCECDLYKDGRCDMRDWLQFGQRWGATNCNTVPCACDLNADGRCDMRDWLIFGQDWGRIDCP